MLAACAEWGLSDFRGGGVFGADGGCGGGLVSSTFDLSFLSSTFWVTA